MYDNIKQIKTEFPAIRVVDLLFNPIGHTANNRRRRSLIDRVIVENQEVYSWLINDGWQNSSLSLIESGVDLSAISPLLRSESIRLSISDGNNDIVVAFFGRWSPEKNPLLFIDVAKTILGTVGVRFIMAGTGPMKDEIKDAIERSNFPNGYFCLLGDVDDALPYIATVDLVVIPSSLDGRPMVALEALACGTPIIASRVGGLPDLVQPGSTGWLCEPDNVESFSNAVLEALSCPNDLMKMRQNARTYAENHLNLNGMCDKYIKIFDELVICPAVS